MGLWFSQVEHRTFNPIVESSNLSKPVTNFLRVVYRAVHNLQKKGRKTKLLFQLYV